MKKIPFHWAILIGMLAGLGFGFLFPAYVPWVEPLGKIFVKLLKMIVIPLIFVSIVNGIARLGNTQRLSELGLRTVAYYLATNAFAVAVSLVLVNLIRPGAGVEVFGDQVIDKPAAASLFDFIPGNIVQAFAEGRSLQIIFVAILFGIAIVTMHRKTPRTILNGLHELNELLLHVTNWIIALAPIGVFALLAGMTQALDWSAFIGIGKFAATIIAALFIHACITIPLIFKAFSDRSVMVYFGHMRSALLSAFSTSSSAATLPITMECVEKKAGVPEEISGFVLPVGATVNMDGTAIYEATACLFVAQALGVELSMMAQVTVFFTASLAAMGAAAIPSAGLITLALVLTAVGLPLEGIGFLLAIDRPLDMTRTVVNVWGDMVGCAVVEGKSSAKKNLKTIH